MDQENFRGRFFGDGFRGRFLGVYGDALGGDLAGQGRPGAVSRLLQAGTGWSRKSRAGPHCKRLYVQGCSQAAPGCSKLLQAAPGCSRLLQAAPRLFHTAAKVLSLLQAAPRLLQAAPGLLQAVQSCHWAKAMPRPPKPMVPQASQILFLGHSGPNAADGCSSFPSEAALELPTGCPQADILP